MNIRVSLSMRMRASPVGGWATTVDDLHLPRSSGHPQPGPFTWLHVPSPKGLPELTGIAAELGLDVELPRVLAGFPGVWVEYGLVEGAYAQRNQRTSPP